MITLIIVLAVLFLSQCMEQSNKKEVVAGEDQSVKKVPIFIEYAGSQTCINCHEDIFESHRETGHFLTSMPARKNFVKGSFQKNKNIFPFHPGLYVAMENTDSGMYQVAYQDGQRMIAGRFDIIMGSGTKGQSFLSWRGNHLFQLPITWFTPAGEWCNSPGYPNKVVFNRSATARCMECHTTYVNVLADPKDDFVEYDSSQMIYGVSCERCHGPAAEHVAYHTKHVGETAGKFIVNPGKLSRQQVLDLCALCHGGALEKTAPSFSFTAGDTLAKYFKKAVQVSPVSMPDVHGNQYGLLQESKCFTQSQTLTCVTCHDSHVKERGEVSVFTQRCMTCHAENSEHFCKLKDVSVATLKARCIDCHMPKQPSMSVAVMLPNQHVPTPAQMRTHIIKVYSDYSFQWTR